MLNKRFLTGLCVSISLLLPVTLLAGEPKGAKAIFDSGEGPSVRMSLDKGKPRTSAPATKAPAEQAQKYIGISYQMALISGDGQFRIVPKSRTFRSGERMKLLVRTNRPGYMTVVNIGPTGNTHVLFNDYVDAYAIHEIPRTTNLQFAGSPGAEKLMVMLSDDPNPLGGAPPADTQTASAAPSQDFEPAYAPSAQDTEPAYDPSPQDMEPAYASADEPPPMSTVASNIEGSKGAKDIVVEDSMQNSFTVISPKKGYRPVKMGGGKDIVLESDRGTHYGVVPVSAISEGGILTLEIKLRHR